jgi:hypothetical protein
MKNIILASILAILATVSTAKAQDKAQDKAETFAKDCLPNCDSAAKVVIFNGSSFDGTVYLHDADVQLSTRQTKAVKAIAADGQLPVICLESGIVVVTANN